ncbi:MAG: carbohydrate-binding domain-containing protein [Clostridiales bacterium]|nr:carbohydrate-binding domain-containing protein [Clostridiales bacterium]
MKRKKQFGLLVLLLLFLLSSIPVSAASGVAATIGDTEYSSLYDAVKEVQNGQIITLQKKFAAESGSRDLKLEADVSYTIDLNGYKMTNGGGHAAIYVRKGTVTMKNGTLGISLVANEGTKVILSSLKTIKANSPKIEIQAGAKLTVSDTTCYSIENNGTATIKSATICHSITNGSSGTMKIKNFTMKSKDTSIENSGKMTIKKGTYYQTAASQTNEIYNKSGATMSISGGTFKTKSNLLINNHGNLTISGGTFTNTKGSTSVAVGPLVANGGTLKITGGTLKSVCGSHANTVNNDGTFKMSGGVLRATGKYSIALNVLSGKVVITGGTIYSKQDYAIEISHLFKGTYKCSKKASVKTGARTSAVYWQE